MFYQLTLSHGDVYKVSLGLDFAPLQAQGRHGFRSFVWEEMVWVLGT